MKTAPKRWKPSTGISFPAAGAFQVRVAPGAPGVWMAFALIGGNLAYGGVLYWITGSGLYRLKWLPLSSALTRHTLVPIVHTDFMSEYPTVNTLLGLWPLLTAKDMKIDGCDARALELWIVGNHRVAALLADIPFRPLQHRPGTIVEGRSRGSVRSDLPFLVLSAFGGSVFRGIKPSAVKRVNGSG
jgi:hypothetical protein